MWGKIICILTCKMLKFISACDMLKESDSA